MSDHGSGRNNRCSSNGTLYAGFYLMCSLGHNGVDMLLPVRRIQDVPLCFAFQNQVTQMFRLGLFALKHCNKVFLELLQRQRNNIQTLLHIALCIPDAMAECFSSIGVDSDRNKHTVHRLFVLQHRIRYMASDGFTFHCFLTGRGGHCNLGENCEIIEFTVQITLATASCRNRHEVRIQLESTDFIRFIHHVVDCKRSSPERPFKICRRFILGYFNGIIFVVNQLSAALNEQRHIVSNLLPLIALIVGILDFICLSKDIFKSLSCNIDLSGRGQRQIRNIKCDMPFLHLLNQIVQ